MNQNLRFARGIFRFLIAMPDQIVQDQETMCLSTTHLDEVVSRIGRAYARRKLGSTRRIAIAMTFPRRGDLLVLPRRFGQ